MNTTQTNDAELYMKYYPSRKERIQVIFCKSIFLFIGFGLTYAFLALNYGNQALTNLFKGISVRNFINSTINIILLPLEGKLPLDYIIEVILSGDVVNIPILVYFIVLTVMLVSINKIFHVTKVQGTEADHFLYRKEKLSSVSFKAFREGSLIFPLVIMFISPFVLQIILPLLIIGILLIELVFPFILMGELFRIFFDNLKQILSQIRAKDSQNQPKGLIWPVTGLLLSFPLGILFILLLHLEGFFNLIYYYVLWENSESLIAVTLWDTVNNLIQVASFGNQLIFDLFEAIKDFIIYFLALSCISVVYLYVKSFISPRIGRFIDRYVFVYSE